MEGLRVSRYYQSENYQARPIVLCAVNFACPHRADCFKAGLVDTVTVCYKRLRQSKNINRLRDSRNDLSGFVRRP